MKFPTSTAFIFVMFIRGEPLISMWMSKDAFLLECRLFEVRRLLEEMR